MILEELAVLGLILKQGEKEVTPGLGGSSKAEMRKG